MPEYLPWAIAAAFFGLTAFVMGVWNAFLHVDLEIMSQARDGLSQDLQDERRRSAWLIDDELGADVAAPPTPGSTTN